MKTAFRLASDVVITLDEGEDHMPTLHVEGSLCAVGTTLRPTEAISIGKHLLQQGEAAERRERDAELRSKGLERL